MGQGGNLLLFLQVSPIIKSVIKLSSVRSQTCQVSRILQESDALEERLTLTHRLMSISRKNAYCCWRTPAVLHARPKLYTVYSLYDLYVPNTRLASFPKENLGTRLECLLVLFPSLVPWPSITAFWGQSHSFLSVVSLKSSLRPWQVCVFGQTPMMPHICPYKWGSGT